jgi:hypothetical protein
VLKRPIKPNKSTGTANDRSAAKIESPKEVKRIDPMTVKKIDRLRTEARKKHNNTMQGSKSVSRNLSTQQSKTEKRHSNAK